MSGSDDTFQRIPVDEKAVRSWALRRGFPMLATERSPYRTMAGTSR